MKKALKIGIGILGIGYAAWTGFIVGGAMPLVTALAKGDTDWAASITCDILQTYGLNSFVTKTILEDAKISVNIANDIMGKTTRDRRLFLFLTRKNLGAL